MTIYHGMPLVIRVRGEFIRGVLAHQVPRNGCHMWFFCHSHPSLLHGGRPDAMPPGRTASWFMSDLSPDTSVPTLCAALLTDSGRVSIVNPLCPKEALT